ncbi:MAG: AAA family ATPase [Nitrospiraceae bacterium]|nr:AAA family ATPase [Nitrospiraceae bacterium]
MDSNNALKAIGLCGSHRSGKTTLAGLLAEKTGLPFIKTNTSGVFKRAGLDPAAPMDAETRLSIQNLVLDAAIEEWIKAGIGGFITDRTPLDMIAYTMADIQGTTRIDEQGFSGYIQRCFKAANRFFKLIVVIQPGIPLVKAEGKAALNTAYLEHLNSLVLGLCADERLEIPCLQIPRATLGLEMRVDFILKRTL